MKRGIDPDTIKKLKDLGIDPSDYDNIGIDNFDDAKAAIRSAESGNVNKIKPSNPYNPNASPSGTKTKITEKMDESTKRSLTRENEAAETLAKNGYNVEQNPIIQGTTRKPDYLIEGEVFDCYSPAKDTGALNIGRTIEEKVVEKGQANRIVLNLDDWKGEIDVLTNQLRENPIKGLEEVLVVKDGCVQSIYP